GSDNALLIFGADDAATDAHGAVQTAEYTIRHDAGMLGVFFSASFSIHNITTLTPTLGITIAPPRLEIVDENGAELASVDYDSGATLSPGATLSFVLSAEVTLTANQTVQVRVYPLRRISGQPLANAAFGYLTCVHWIS